MKKLFTPACSACQVPLPSFIQGNQHVMESGREDPVENVGAVQNSPVFHSALAAAHSGSFARACCPTCIAQDDSSIGVCPAVTGA